MMRSSKECNLLVAGVGGQGSVLIGNILGNAAIEEGLEVWVGETFGMSQRGGSVVSHVRISHDIISPITPEGAGHAILGLEPLETLRVAGKFLHLGGNVIINPRPLLPSDVISGLATYPSLDQMMASLKKIAGSVVQIPAAKLAEASGSNMTVNTVMLGALAGSGLLPLSASSIEEALRDGVPPKTVDVNMRAFHLGADAIRSAAVNSEREKL
ncbi:MAG: indolepyruvate oxidoreductase subunit beta [Desulfobacterota bacterium]|nr:indolepyruvate oxidoreductase subunit beta [Thermodesulfobacteriota bacterium]